MELYRNYSALPELEKQKVRAYINLDFLIQNYKKLCGICNIQDSKSNAKPTRDICIVKADAYGHGADKCVSALCDAGCDFFAVSCIEEALAVRHVLNEKKNCSDILILGYTPPEYAELLARHRITQSLLSYDYACALEKEAKKSNVTVQAHAAVDTGMNRIGFSAVDKITIQNTAELIKQISHSKNLKLCGMFTHFASADGEEELTKSDDSQTRKQANLFIQLKNILFSDRISLFTHACNSAAAVRFPEYKFDGVRFGIMLYGYNPSEHINVPLLPVMRLETEICHIHSAGKGEKVGYGGAYTAQNDIKIATLPIGYADGFIRKYSGCNVNIHIGNSVFQAPIIGRICMDQCMIDITNIQGVTVGNKVVLFGDDPYQLHNLSESAETIEYESLCAVSARVVRKY